MSAHESVVTDSRSEKKSKYKLEIVWRNVALLFLVHIFALYGVFVLLTESKYLTVIYAWYFCAVFTNFGIQCGAHRLWSHRSYKAKLPLRIFLMILNSMCAETPIYDWARDHRVHHKYSETDADPHNAKRGFFFAHCGWLLCKKHPDVRQMGKGLDLTDLDNDCVVQFQRKHYYALILVFWAFIPIFIPCYFWSESLKVSIFVCLFLRYAITLNLIWCVNSVAHLWGNKPYDKKINPAECVFKHFMFGEGYHNYHHTFPWDYSASEFGGSRSFNPATIFIDMCAKLGLAYDLKKASPTMIDNTRKRSGSSEPTYNSLEIFAGIAMTTLPVVIPCLIKFIINK